ncbi:prephenate-dependent tRNA uridine(34) hydroxylase TrhP [Pseudidiomarina andamanensis]|uniref:U32 family peptidase n=1 Tax=Pseudidiomarina andamanensis TaxID=1940690 RepID=A0AA92IMT9_9GAMM|nr:tRNA 5-hydroxyuridine modification protein YegQ [Pseudidiomarina andamanensis]MDS0219433.1 tRNA 5-hydroxyuridine modification protein YegQ [Pseudidiomarina andamanensis]QGT96152.1 U32 family peptidase [Pseudidiomarina andamanensis]
MSSHQTGPELLSPAGSIKAMRLAFAYGADAVYAGQPRYSLRVRNNEFDLPRLEQGINEAHALGKKFYVVVNIAPHNAKLVSFVEDMAPVVALKPDALIVSDPGIVMLLRQHYPEQALHLSVQANTVNWAAVQFWQQQGIERVILSRELEVREIADIREKCPDMELEVFVHGALCMAYSGRCLLSGYFNKRDPNQGACTNSCRWPYQVHDAEEDAVGQFNPIDTPVLLTEPQRPGEYMLMDEDLHGTYIMNSKDLRGIEHVEALTRMGVHSLKIEGRTKSPYYVARTAQVYRQAIDDAVAGKPFNRGLLADLEGMANRGFTEGFLRRHVPSDTQNYDTSHSLGEQLLVGEVLSVEGADAYVDVKNAFAVGDTLILMKPSGNVTFTLSAMRDAQNEPLPRAAGAGRQVHVQLPIELTDDDAHFSMLIKIGEHKPQQTIPVVEVTNACGD